MWGRVKLLQDASDDGGRRQARGKRVDGERPRDCCRRRGSRSESGESDREGMLGDGLDLELGSIWGTPEGGRKGGVGFCVGHANAKKRLVVVHDGDAKPATAVVAGDAGARLAIWFGDTGLGLLALELSTEISDDGGLSTAFCFFLTEGKSEQRRERKEEDDGLPMVV